MSCRRRRYASIRCLQKVFPENSACLVVEGHFGPDVLLRGSRRVDRAKSLLLKAAHRQRCISTTPHMSRAHTGEHREHYENKDEEKDMDT